ncbi:TVP38/TMEM64 family inner membrane protein YdjZ [compost metagenome]
MVVLYMRLMPFFPFDGISYGAGLSKIRFWDYTWATFIGIIPGAIVYNVFGASLNDIWSWKFLGAVVMYAVFAIVPLVIKRRQDRKVRQAA